MHTQMSCDIMLLIQQQTLNFLRRRAASGLDHWKTSYSFVQVQKEQMFVLPIPGRQIDLVCRKYSGDDMKWKE